LLRQETVGGFLLLVAALAALVLANSGWADSYGSLRDHAVGPDALHLSLSLGAWAADGLLAVFFFVAGLELKHELVAGELRDPRRAALPVAAAVAGMVVPALLFCAVNAGTGDLRGWAIPTATDIAFALAVLGLVGSRLPTALRAFLLTLAVVDDLLAIAVIALFFTADLSVGPLLLAAVPLAAFAAVVRRRRAPWWVLVPLALTTWGLVHASGVHATVAGVLLAATVPVLATDGRPSRARRWEHLLRPVSAGLAVPVFAFFSAGVAVGGWDGLGDALHDRVTLGVAIALVVGKAAGVFGGTWLVTRFTHAELDEQVAWADVFGLAVLAGMGFTVSLLLAELAYGGVQQDHAKVGVLVGSVLAAALATVVLRRRVR
jgi:NhaA family Na+:H+ antiporter